MSRNPAALDRINLAAARVRKILERQIVAHQRTLEQKISDQGPNEMRVDPHLVGYAIKDLVERGILREHSHSGTNKWFSHRLERTERTAETLDRLAPLYSRIARGQFPNRVGDALEFITFKTIQNFTTGNRRFQYFGNFDVDAPKDALGRYRKNEPPRRIGDRATTGNADFIIAGFDEGPIFVECKNCREWLYPDDGIIKELIIKSLELNTVPVLIHRRIQYSTIANFLRPAGIIAHQSYHQYYPADESELAAQVRHKTSLGFTDVIATETPHPRTTRFFTDLLPRVLPDMASRWNANEAALFDFASGRQNIAQLYTAIGSPAGGKWRERKATEDDVADSYDAYYQQDDPHND